MAQWVGNLILLAALLAAVWYAWETRKLRLQTIRPKLVFFTRQHRAETLDDLQAFDLWIKNVGVGVAINISTEIEKKKDDLEMLADPEAISVLEKDEEMEIAIRPAKGSYKPDMKMILDDPSISIRLTARYLDVENREFRTSTTVGAGSKSPFIREL